VRRSSFRNALTLSLGLALAGRASGQEPGVRLTYRLRVMAAHAGDTIEIAHAEVAGPLDTDLRLHLAADSAEVGALLSVLPEPDSLTLDGQFLSRRNVGRSRHGLPVWTEDQYQRAARMGWGRAVRVLPFGRARSGGRALWLLATVDRTAGVGATRPTETVEVVEPDVVFTAEAVARPRRATVTLTLERGDTVSAPRVADLVPDGPPRAIDFSRGTGAATMLQVALAYPEPPPPGRDRVLARGADEVCLRVNDPAGQAPARVICGRLNNVARGVPLAGGDTLFVTFAWPGAR